MTPLRHWMLGVLIACAAMMTNCAASRPVSMAAPPRLMLGEMATKPCRLPRLPEPATIGGLEAVYIERGAAILACDQARAAAVETLQAERVLINRWLAGSDD